MASLAIWFDQVFVATAVKWWKTLTNASTVWRRWLLSLSSRDGGYFHYRLATVATLLAEWRCPTEHVDRSDSEKSVTLCTNTRGEPPNIASVPKAFGLSTKP